MRRLCRKAGAVAHWRSILLVTIVSGIGVATIVSACTIPVFQYALDYWPPDVYQATVFHRGAMSPDAQAAATMLQQAATDARSAPNIAVEMVNLDDASELINVEASSALDLPWLQIRYPVHARARTEVWSGRLTTDAVKSALHSPVLEEVSSRLLSGESAVWVFLESGVQARDDAAAGFLNARLIKMSATLKVAAPDETGAPDHQSGESVRFSMIRLSRDNPDEKISVQMLLGTEWDLKTVSQPIAFPVFGRGRVLYALVGDGINAENIRAASDFLIGWCSCQVKELNPGVDLLMSADWGEIALDTASAAVINYTPAAAAVEKGDSPLRKHILFVVLIQVLLVAIAATGVVVWRMRRRTH